MAARATVVREGMIAGLLGAAGVAVWFLAVDTLGGSPLHTPAVLGRAVLGVLGRGIEEHSMTFFVLGYTVLHVAAFVGVGIIAAMLFASSRRAPQFTAALALFFVVFETAFYFLSLMLSGTEALGTLAWYQIGAANLLASALMGTYLLRRHPEFAGNLAHALDGSS